MPSTERTKHFILNEIRSYRGGGVEQSGDMILFAFEMDHSGCCGENRRQSQSGNKNRRRRDVSGEQCCIQDVF